MIPYACPNCGQKFESEDHVAGEKYSCPVCGQRLQIPAPVSGTTANTGTNKTRLGVPSRLSVAPPPIVPVLEVAEEDDEGEDYRRPARRSRRHAFRCPECGSTHRPEEKKEIAPLGWVLFVVLLLFFLPLCWLGFFFKDTWEICWDCGRRVRKVDGPTFGI